MDWMWAAVWMMSPFVVQPCRCIRIGDIVHQNAWLQTGVLKMKYYLSGE
jgi:hypothetical protein